jgi:hypothetical protein
VLDDVDQCPGKPEDPDGHQDDDGCPDANDDGDSVPDSDDECPREAEDTDGVEDDDGCPDLDDDKDGVPDASDACKGEVEDQDGWLDDDGCQDSDDDRDGVPDSVDRCLDEPETLASLKDTDEDGCPDGTPLARPAADGTLVLLPEAERALVWKKGAVETSKQGDVVLRAIALAAHRAAWDAADPALVVIVFDDRGGWSELAERRTEAVVNRLGALGVRARAGVPSGEKGRLVIVAPAAAIEKGAAVPVKQK